ncbi:hypothetical protein [Legionella rowbothamii]|uniref:hypothetical protein n=1 Tax=Legionella rowbothamii TaxID=96229 RepID=UPI0010548DB0|nr:hypothetical protein [Legionella rowbothamii]
MSQSKFSINSFFNLAIKKKNKLKQLDASFKALIQNGCVEGFPPGIVINEYHSHKFPKEFLIANFQYFKSIGIETLFFEFANDNNQHLFDELLDGNRAVAINSRLINGDEDTRAVAMAAIQAGIRIVALDCKKAREGSPEYFRHPTQKDWDEYYQRRDSIFDENVRRIFLKEHQSKPYLFYSGLAHGNNHHGFPSFFSSSKLTLLLSDDGFDFQVNGIKQHLYVDDTIFSEDLGRYYCLVNKHHANQKIRCLNDAIDEGYLDEDRAAFLTRC